MWVMEHRMDNDEKDPGAECGLSMAAVFERGDSFAFATKAPTCPECLVYDAFQFWAATGWSNTYGRNNRA
jgi:hypothetical protein